MLQFRLCRLFGLVKLRLYKAAADDLETLGNLDDVVYTYEHYATYYPNKKGAPFVVKWFPCVTLLSLLSFRFIDSFHTSCAASRTPWLPW